MNNTIQRCARTALAAAALVISAAAAADGADRRELTGEWWQWAVSIPVGANPVLDPSGASCMVGQRGDIWFLAGSFGSSASRTCSVPQGVKLFFPVANSINFDTPGVCGQVGRLTVAELRAFSATFINSVTQTSATVDSRPVRPLRRIRSEVFPVALPEQNIFTAPPNCVVPAAVYPRAVDDGYYALIDDLPPGEHIVQIAASNGNNFNLNVTYRLIVVPRDRH